MKKYCNVKFPTNTFIDMIKLVYFSDTRNFYADDFKNNKNDVFINIDDVSSVRSPKVLNMPFSNEIVGKYFEVRMKNGDKYLCDEKYWEVIQKWLING